MIEPCEVNSQLFSAESLPKVEDLQQV